MALKLCMLLHLQRLQPQKHLLRSLPLLASNCLQEPQVGGVVWGAEVFEVGKYIW